MTSEELARIRCGLPLLLDRLAVFQDLDFSNENKDETLRGCLEMHFRKGVS